MRGTATFPDGSQKDLLWIRQWDIRWQDRYRYQSPLFLPKGTTLSMRFTFDNSATNPRNPSKPPQRVRAGPRSIDEMAQLWLEVVPRRAEDAAVLNADYLRRAVLANVAGAELKESRQRVIDLETDNQALRQRIDSAKERLRVLAARLSFLEQHGGGNAA